MLLRLARERRVLFVGGKGGVGKTTVASALALARAREGGNVLVVSTDPAHNLGHLWAREVGDEPQLLWSGSTGRLHGLEISADQTVRRHLDAVAATMERLLPRRLHAAAARHLELARNAPGTHEAALLERIADAVADGLVRHDLVVFDTAPTGHTLRLIALPEQLGAWTEQLLANRDRSERLGAAVRGLGGTDLTDRDAELRRVLQRRRARFASLRDAVTDTASTAFVIVLAAETMPVAESLELYRQLRAQEVSVGALVANRRSPTDSGELLATRRAAEDAVLEEVRRLDVPLVELPLLAGEPVGEAGLARLAATFPV